MVRDSTLTLMRSIKARQEAKGWPLTEVVKYWGPFKECTIGPWGLLSVSGPGPRRSLSDEEHRAFIKWYLDSAGSPDPWYLEPRSTEPAAELHTL